MWSDYLQLQVTGYNRFQPDITVPLTGHPRVYGANYMNEPTWYVGAHPRAYGGKLQEISSPLNNHRCIPVYTGANNRFLTRHTSCLGSSPCIRGGFSSIPVGPERCGFIPARGGRSNSRIMSHATIRFIPVHTGQMQFCFHLTAVRTAHPRTYGADKICS